MIIRKGQTMKKLIAGLSMAIFALGSAEAGELDIYLSSQSVQAGYSMDTGKIGYGGGNLIFGGYYDTDHDWQANAGLMVLGTPTANQPFTYGLGVMGYFSFIDEPNDDVQAITLGGLIKYHIPAKMPMAVSAQLFFAPEITTFGDGKNFGDFQANYEVSFLPSATGYVGYRLTRTDLNNYGNYDIEDSFHVGVRLMF
jgi:hypothetical protein